ncbi:hypothetical protein MPH_12905 [Macrophomina phaseolina MS6]|uniref:Condensation domain-containing protein n=1 Tax=Macrophomina phaseolina (strain MS6) TaxID=1126212 RepID=K2QJM9_MACPH|nr:hypothetical protein MPH_12905 [Macrophomina phaseolina MS6]
MPPMLDEIRAERQVKSVNVPLKTSLEALRTLCSENGLTISTIFHAAWALILRQFCDSDSVCFGTMVSSRDAPVKGIEDSIGPFVNIMACPVNLQPDDTLMQFLKDLQERFTQSLQHASSRTESSTAFRVERPVICPTSALALRCCWTEKSTAPHCDSVRID